jgi:hypothetical protein
MKPEDGAARVNMGCEIRQPGRRVESVWAVIKGAVNLPAPSKVAWPDPLEITPRATSASAVAGWCECAPRVAGPNKCLAQNNKSSGPARATKERRAR